MELSATSGPRRTLLPAMVALLALVAAACGGWDPPEALPGSFTAPARPAV